MQGQNKSFKVAVGGTIAMAQQQPVYILIQNRYVLGKKLGSGSFGEVFAAVDKESGMQVAIKMEPYESVADSNRTTNNVKRPILEHEWNVYTQIYKANCGIPKIYFFGREDDYRIIVMDMLGANLETILTRLGHKFSLKTVLMLADQLISRIEYLHSKHFIHRDIKPENFLIGLGTNMNQIFLVDYGLAKKYRSATKHIPYKSGNRLIGTARYVSVNSHKGNTLSRRDDMESIGYLLVYFLKGRLPWQAVKCEDKVAKYEEICKIKEETPLESLCSDIPIEFSEYLKYVRGLSFTEKPNYNYLRNLFQNLFREQKFVYDLVFDWATL